MKNNEHEFDLVIWSELLKVLNKVGFIPTINYITSEFRLSNRIANAYRFALANRNLINPDPNLSRQLGIALNNNRDLKRHNAKLTVENELLNAKIHFLQAIEMTSAPSISKPLRIGTASMATDENTAIALFSDAHVEERIDPLVVNGKNEQNPKIAELKIKLYFKRLLWMIKSFRQGGWKINNLVLAFMGDLINGYIHEEFIEDNFSSPTEAVLFIQDLLVEGIKFLADEGNFNEIIIVGKYGNHGRTSKKKKYSTGWKNSYEWMMYTQIRKLFTNYMPGYDKIKFVIERGEFTTIEVYGKRICFSHGDHFNYQGGIGGILVPFNRWIHKMEEILDADRYYVAHWHTLMSTKKGVMNGSIVGYSPFALGHGFAPEPPQQHLGLLDSKRGFTIEVPIILEDWK